MHRYKKQLQHNVTGMECTGDVRGLAGFPQVTTEVWEEYFSRQRQEVFPIRSVGSKP